ncbi:MAG: glycoside hydrolase [Sulfobacillus acidophilus]|uniref:Glycoside hydrolase n=1 Tax=Sulfobacillus acidophilus TaxID=53633 RepID=A0A2T2WNE9_9FIRM|nr:MAG: glycoside hydrolase [Sulfobacillus acidophilus]
MKRTFAPWLISTAIASAWAGGCGTTPAPQSKANTNASRSSVSTRNSSKKLGAATKASGAPLKMIAFYDQSMSTVTPDPFALIEAHPGIVTYLAPFWYEVSPSGSIISKPEGNVATLAAQAHLPLMPLFNNAAGTDRFLRSQTTRSMAIHNIVALVKAKKYAGAQIDFQLLKSTDRADLTTFMQQLDKAMPKGTVLSMSVVPLTSGNGQSAAYNFAALDKAVDSMVLMAYDLHGSGTPPGPVAPYAWVKKSITTALKAGIQPSKLYLGIADYGYLWTNGSTAATTIPLKVMHQHKYGIYTWNPRDKDAYDKYTVNGNTHIIWFENDRAAADRIALAKQYHLGGVAVWRIGYEDAQWWNTVAKAMSTPAAKSSAGTTNAARPKVSPQHAAKKTATKIKRTGNRIKNKARGPARKTLIAPAHKAKKILRKTTRP